MTALRILLLVLVLASGSVIPAPGQAEASGSSVQVRVGVDLPSQRPARDERSRALERLIARAMSLTDHSLADGASPTGWTAGSDSSGLYVDVGGLPCDQAVSFVEQKLLAEPEIAIGLVGNEPVLRSWGIEETARIQDGDVLLLLRPTAAKALRAMTAEHIGGAIAVRVGEFRQEIPIQVVVDSGRIQIDGDGVPPGFAEKPLVGYPMRAEDCTEP